MLAVGVGRTDCIVTWLIIASVFSLKLGCQKQLVSTKVMAIVENSVIVNAQTVFLFLLEVLVISLALFEY
jgi:hypothetical protein